jgi:hypothetical protein
MEPEAEGAAEVTEVQKHNRIADRLRALFPHDSLSIDKSSFRLQYVPVNFETLMKISEALGTMKFTVEGFFECNTYVDTVEESYGLEFTYDPKDIPEMEDQPK